MGRLFLRIFLSFWFATAFLLITLAAGFLLVRPDAVASWRAVGQRGMIYVGTMAADKLESDGAEASTRLLDDFMRRSTIPAWLYGPSGELLSGKEAPPGQRQLALDAIEADGVQHAAFESDILLARRVESSSGKPYVIVWRTQPLLPLPVLPATWGTIYARVILLILAAGVVCWWLTWRFLHPLRLLRGAARRFSRGDLSHRVATRPEFRRSDEFSELARDFDEMAARIDALVSSQQQFLADISHELRSPLARLSLALELARRRLGDGVAEHDRMEREVHRLEDLIKQLLTLARLQGRDRQAALEPVDLRALVLDVAADADFEASGAGKRVVVAAECEATIEGNAALLRGAIENVVRNGVRYTPESTEVTIAMTRDAATDEISIAVEDQGPGVPADAVGRVFDPFFRVDAARDRDSGGVGLGLAIAQQAMRQHGGTTRAENRKGGGLRVTLVLPAPGWLSRSPIRDEP